MSEFPADHSWTKRMARFCEVSRMSEAKCWSAAADTDCFDIHEWLDLAEATLLTKTQKAQLKEWTSQ